MVYYSPAFLFLMRSLLTPLATPPIVRSVWNTVSLFMALCSSMLMVIITFSQATEAELGSFSPDDIKDFSPPQVVEFLAQLVDKVKLNLRF